jgi:hypothetical protein
MAAWNNISGWFNQQTKKITFGDYSVSINQIDPGVEKLITPIAVAWVDNYLGTDGKQTFYTNPEVNPYPKDFVTLEKNQEVRYEVISNSSVRGPGSNSVREYVFDTKTKKKVKDIDTATYDMTKKEWVWGMEKVDINNLETWLEQYQEYWQSILGRNDLRKGKTDEEIKTLEAKWLKEDQEFDIFVKQARRIFLTKKAKEGFQLTWEGSKIDVKEMTDEKILWLYLKYNLDKKQVSTISLREARDFQITTQNIVDSLSYTGDFNYCDQQNNCKMIRKLFSGVVGAGLRFDQEYIEKILRGKIGGLYDIKGGHLPIFGIADYYRSYDNFHGQLMGLFYLPGVDPENGVGVLGYFRNHQGEPRLLASATTFNETIYPEGTMALDSNSNVISFTSDSVYPHAHTLGDSRLPTAEKLTLEKMVDRLGIVLSFDNGGFALPFGLGLQGTNNYYFSKDISRIIDTPPWDEYLKQEHILNP